MVYKVTPWSVLDPQARGHLHVTAMMGTVSNLQGTTRSPIGFHKSTYSGTLPLDSDEGHGGGSMIQGGTTRSGLGYMVPTKSDSSVHTSLFLSF